MTKAKLPEQRPFRLCQPHPNKRKSVVHRVYHAAVLANSERNRPVGEGSTLRTFYNVPGPYLVTPSLRRYQVAGPPIPSRSMVPDETRRSRS